ncbi:unnamed protein product [Orchesella dallaii]|uniref:Rho guanine nucleotide exchange factor 12 n=1 Tax=Orchesella dallaii TaxID=48710 RepID=A0ABP1PYI5_9HEXA
MDPSIWNTRAVIVHRDDNGYGLTVSGDNPVNVQTIKKDGAADRAGIREGDIILKVNGTLVEHMNHTEVVNLIRAAGAYVTLTVKPSDLISMPGVGLIGGNGGRPHDRVTAPLPVNSEIQQQLQGNKLRTLQAMRDKAQADVERLWKKYEMTQNPRDMSDFEKAQQGLKKIESQMKTFRQSTPNLQLHAPAPFNSYPHNHHQPVPFQPYPHLVNSPMGPVIGAPPRHRNPLSAQSSVPSYENVRWGDVDEPPPLPPRSYPHATSSPYPPPPPQSSEHSGYHPPPGYSPHDPLAQVYPGGFHGVGYPLHFSSSPSPTNSLSGYGLCKSYSSPPSTTNNHNHVDMVNNSKLCNTSMSSGSHPLQQTHHRAKSSPDPVAMQKALSCAEGSRRSDSVSDLTKSNSLNSKSRSSAAWDSIDSSNHLSPPGSPPPPYGRHSDNDSSGFGDESHTPSGSVNISNLDIFAAKLTGGALGNRPSSNPAVDIISMEEDDGLCSGDLALPTLSGKHGPYSSLSKLLEHNAHLAVFINYVIDNRLDPSSLLFYLITGLNLEDGNVKEMKRWCYEIHSTFTAPGAPLLIPKVAENIAAEIDEGLVHESDKEEMMRRVFRKARHKAREEINKQLEEFCNKRIAGLGSMFGPPDNQLEESINDPAKQLKIVETYLLPRLDQFNEDYEKNSDDRTLAIVNAIATVLIKQFGVRNQQSSNSVIEKCPSFVSKEKSIRSKLMSKHTKKVTLNGHHLTPQYYSLYTECNICSKLLWGVGPQGFQCVDCHVNIHRGCMSLIQDNCLGTSQRKEKNNDKFWKLKDKIRPAQEQRRRFTKKNSDDLTSMLASVDLDPGDRPLTGSGSSASSLKGDRRPDTLNEERVENDGLVCENEDMDRMRHEPKRGSNAVGRSESCKEPQRVNKQPRERRKHSDPNLTSKSSDVDLDNQRHLSDANNSGSSSNSSLSARSLDSPNTSSLELAGPSVSSSSLRARDSETPDHSAIRHSELITSSFNTPPKWEGDSDIEIEQDPPDWTKDVPEETLSGLDRLEKKRQEVINELFHTERLYVRKLKIMDRLFFRPIVSQQLLSADVVHLLFPNLEEVLEIHEQFNSTLKKKRTESPLVGDIGPVLLESFDGEKGEQLRHAASTFCARQQIGLELLRERRKRDMKFHAFLTEAESDPVCRRLGIKDMIPTVMQRLTKYPLLFESLCNCTAADSTEYKNLQRALELSKEVLCSVNLAKKEAEDEERLTEIQRRLDKSFFEKGNERTDHSFNDLRNFDFTRHKLIYDGSLIWRKPKGDRLKTEHQEVLLVLLEDMIVLLLKVDDKYVLKMHNTGSGKADRMPAKPIIKLNTLHATRVAADKRAFYLLSKTSPIPFMFELVCSTPEERTLWLQHITKAADEYKSRQESRRCEVPPINNIPPSAAESEDRTKEPAEGADTSVAEQSDQASDPGTLQEPEAGTSSKKDTSPAPENPSSSASGGDESPQSPEKGATGDGKLSIGAKGGQSDSASPSPARRKQGEFLRVTESSPLIDPSEVVVNETPEVHFAKLVISPYGTYTYLFFTLLLFLFCRTIYDAFLANILSQPILSLLSCRVCVSPFYSLACG